MIDFERFWTQDDDHWQDAGEDRPGVSAGEIAEWEARHGVKLPDPIRTALGLRNGGHVRNASLEILPLDEIVPVDDDFWTFAGIDEAEARDRGLMFVFGNEMEVGGTYLLNFNAHGPEGQPSVYLDFHGESTDLVGDTLEELFASLLAAADAPSVDWSQTEVLPVLARERIDLSPMYEGRPASLDQVLTHNGDHLVLFTHECTDDRQVLTRTVLPLPLETASAEVQPHRPPPLTTFALYLEPEMCDGIVHDCSEMTDDGRWKNSTNRGVPVYVTFESLDRERLVSLRKELLGAANASRAEARQQRQAKVEEMLGTLSPEERTSTLLQAALNFSSQLERELPSASADAVRMPPELADLAETMRRKMDQMLAQVQRAHAPDAATVEQLGKLRDDIEEE